ncbi:hypothetical protein V8C35DRAFT_24252 [Trichoderma chlorosporum]
MVLGLIEHQRYYYCYINLTRNVMVSHCLKLYITILSSGTPKYSFIIANLGLQALLFGFKFGSASLYSASHYLLERRITRCVKYQPAAIQTIGQPGVW